MKKTIIITLIMFSGLLLLLNVANAQSWLNEPGVDNRFSTTFDEEYAFGYELNSSEYAKPLGLAEGEIDNGTMCSACGNFSVDANGYCTNPLCTAYDPGNFLREEGPIRSGLMILLLLSAIYGFYLSRKDKSLDRQEQEQE